LCLYLRPPPTPPLFPYTTLFRSRQGNVSLGINAVDAEQRFGEAVSAGEDPSVVAKDTVFTGAAGDPVVATAADQVIILAVAVDRDRKSTRLNSSHVSISYAVFCL